MRRVALLSLHSSPLAPIGSADAGGMNVYVHRVADELSRQGLRVDVFTRRTDRQAPEMVRTKDGARIIHLRAGPARPIPKSVLPLHIPAMTASLRAFMAREQVRYDLVHSHYWLSGLVALRSADTFRAPVVHMFHTLSKVKEFYTGEPDPSDSALRFCGERIVIAGAHTLVGATAQEEEWMERLYGVAPASFTVIPLGVDLDVFRPQDKESCRRLLNLEADRVVLFVGRPDRIKCLDVLLQSLAELVPVLPFRLKLVVVGDGGSSRRDPYRRMVASLGLQDVVDFRGIVPQRELALYYSAADLCAIPSAYESFGMAAIEAMACQTPPVAFATGGLATTIKDGQTGFLAPSGDRRAYTSILATALQSSAMLEMGRRARLSVRRYEWSAVVNETLDLYDRVWEGSLLGYGALGGY